MLSPLTYFAAYTVILGIVYVFVLPLMTGAQTPSKAWRGEWKIITQVAVLNTGSYLLALMALQTGQASYVIALRQLSIAVAAILGWRLLGESFPSRGASGWDSLSLGVYCWDLHGETEAGARPTGSRSRDISGN